ncbi:chemotaxis protein CheW [Halorarum salinum]|uniref:Chemotaxis protein CheW n=1 Tax=Halorarum salinum TaxID=2743089 RepID=A0A7D5Q8Z7_9EURY|nr:chemotaxis protein CheW [Halobaculum salinum]QLG60618.1 chemotaxis protein CheW [Halobaculum salinum]
MSESGVATELEVLEFSVGGEEYCIGLEGVEEVVRMDGALTPLPNADRSVLGVMDLRGRTTSVLDPGVAFGAGGSRASAANGDGVEYVVVLSGDDGTGTEATGWLVDEVNRMVSIGEDAVDTSVADGPVRGVLKGEDGFTVWVDPGRVN